MLVGLGFTPPSGQPDQPSRANLRRRQRENRREQIAAKANQVNGQSWTGSVTRSFARGLMEYGVEDWWTADFNNRHSTQ